MSGLLPRNCMDTRCDVCRQKIFQCSTCEVRDTKAYAAAKAARRIGPNTTPEGGATAAVTVTPGPRSPLATVPPNPFEFRGDCVGERVFVCSTHTTKYTNKGFVTKCTKVEGKGPVTMTYNVKKDEGGSLHTVHQHFVYTLLEQPDEMNFLAGPSHLQFHIGERVFGYQGFSGSRPSPQKNDSCGGGLVNCIAVDVFRHPCFYEVILDSHFSSKKDHFWFDAKYCIPEELTGELRAGIALQSRNYERVASGTGVTGDENAQRRPMADLIGQLREQLALPTTSFAQLTDKVQDIRKQEELTVAAVASSTADQPGAAAPATKSGAVNAVSYDIGATHDVGARVFVCSTATSEFTNKGTVTAKQFNAHVGDRSQSWFYDIRKDVGGHFSGVHHLQVYKLVEEACIDERPQLRQHEQGLGDLCIGYRGFCGLYPDPGANEVNGPGSVISIAYDVFGHPCFYELRMESTYRSDTDAYWFNARNVVPQDASIQMKRFVALQTQHRRRRPCSGTPGGFDDMITQTRGMLDIVALERQHVAPVAAPTPAPAAASAPAPAAAPTPPLVPVPPTPPLATVPLTPGATAATDNDSESKARSGSNSGSSSDSSGSRTPGNTAPTAAAGAANAAGATKNGEGEAGSESSCSSSTGGKRKRGRKFTPNKEHVFGIMYVIASNSPYTHERNSQKHIWSKVIEECCKQGMVAAATEYRQMRAWCNKICEKHHSDMQETIGKSGTAELPEPTIIDTVSEDWAQYQLRSGKVSKIISAHAKIIRDACVSTNTTIPILSAASASRKHNALQRTREAAEAARARGTGAPCYHVTRNT